MAVDVTKLKATPSNVSKGTTKVKMNFFGVVDGASDNPVKLKLFIEPSSDAFFVKDGTNVKTIDNKKNFDTSPSLQSWDVVIAVTASPDGPKSCSLRLEAIDSSGNRSSVNSFIIIQ